MLQGMECFDGIFVCMINLFDWIDEVVLWWFVFKICFKLLVCVQCEQMFIVEVLGGKVEVFKLVWCEMLVLFDMFMFGDFVVVKQQFVLLGEMFDLEVFFV